MVLAKRFEGPDIVSATLAGVVTSRDQEELVSFVRATVQLTGQVSILLRLEQFAGWHPDPKSRADTSWLRDDEGVSRIAIVGETAWKIAVMTLIAQPLRSVPIAYFANEESARCWLDRTSHVETPASSP